MSKITVDAFLAAQDTIKAYREQQEELAAQERKAKREELASALANLGDSTALEAWALGRWEDDKRRGIGKGMTETNAKLWYLKNLRAALVDVCDAFGLDRDAIVACQKATAA